MSSLDGGLRARVAALLEQAEPRRKTPDRRRAARAAPPPQAVQVTIHLTIDGQRMAIQQPAQPVMAPSCCADCAANPGPKTPIPQAMR